MRHMQSEESIQEETDYPSCRSMRSKSLALPQEQISVLEGFFVFGGFFVFFFKGFTIKNRLMIHILITAS